MSKHTYSNAHIGERIRYIRTHLNNTQSEFSEAIGISTIYLSYIENGKKGISRNVLYTLCTKFDVSADYVLFGKKNTLPDLINDALLNSSDFKKEELNLWISYLTSIRDIMDLPMRI